MNEQLDRLIQDAEEKLSIDKSLYLYELDRASRNIPALLLHRRQSRKKRLFLSFLAPVGSVAAVLIIVKALFFAPVEQTLEYSASKQEGVGSLMFIEYPLLAHSDDYEQAWKEISAEDAIDLDDLRVNEMEHYLIGSPDILSEYILNDYSEMSTEKGRP